MTVETGVRLRRSRRNLTVLALAILTATGGTFWLADSATLQLSPAATPSGIAPDGTLATFTALIPSTVSVPQGQGGQLIAGVLLGKVTNAAGFAPRLKTDIAWLDPQDAGAVLNNPNAWMNFGLYYPIHTGSCSGSDPAGALTITDSLTLCVALNTAATGPLTYNGQTTISSTNLSGYLFETANDPASPTTCSATGSTWCAPTGTAVNQNVFYVVASINLPGGTPPGQQSLLTSLSFYLTTRSV